MVSTFKLVCPLSSLPSGTDWVVIGTQVAHRVQEGAQGRREGTDREEQGRRTYAIPTRPSIRVGRRSSCWIVESTRGVCAFGIRASRRGRLRPTDCRAVLVRRRQCEESCDKGVRRCRDPGGTAEAGDSSCRDGDGGDGQRVRTRQEEQLEWESDVGELEWEGWWACRQHERERRKSSPIG